MCKFRDLRADEIECRIQQVKVNKAFPEKSGVILLLYKDARVDMNVLDETVGSSNWQNKFYEHKGILFCSLGINTNYDKPEMPDRWVWKDDAGVESNTEAEKGNASDARKRAGFAWGIGRELYTSPFIWVGVDKCDIKNEKCFDRFEVEKIVIENKCIKALSIRNVSKKCTAFTFGSFPSDGKKQEKPQEEPLTYESALAFKITFGEYSGKTLQELWKENNAYVKGLYNSETTDPRLKEAISIINAEIQKYKAAKA